jgi:hypothetical protein
MARRVAVALLKPRDKMAKAKKRKTREAFSRRGFSLCCLGIAWKLDGAQGRNRTGTPCGGGF